MLDESLKAESVQKNEGLYSYLEYCAAVVDAALYWQETIEQSFLVKISNDSHKAEGFESRIAKLATEAQEMVNAAVSLSIEENSTELEKIKKNLQNLQKEVDKEINVCMNHPEFANYLERLKQLEEFLRYNSVNQNVKSPTEVVNGFESKMYTLLETANAVEKLDIDTATDVRSKITDLMKELTSYKSTLRKGNSDQKEYLINRLEDLQENLADFEHNFSTKFHFTRGLGDIANDKYKAKLNEDAQKEHIKASDDLFQL